MKIGIAQINSNIGDFPRNAKLIMQAYRACVDTGAEIVVTPELSLVGYPPRDLVTKDRFVEKCLQALDYLADETGDIPLIVGYIDFHDFVQPGKPLRNAAAFLHQGRIRKKIWKTLLPSYDIFDEHKYFEPSSECKAFNFGGRRIGLTIGEDIWLEDYIRRPIYQRDPIAELKEDGADLIINISASPFYKGIPKHRASLLEVVACGANAPLVCCNAVGMNEQLVFDGNSLVLDADGNEISNLPGFTSCFKVVDISKCGTDAPKMRCIDVEDVHKGLVLGIQDYARKAGFGAIAMILNGNIESSLVACLAVRALGADQVKVLIMPDECQSIESVCRAVELAEKLGIEHKNISVDVVKQSADLVLGGILTDLDHPLVDQGVSSRIRAMLLMAYARSNNYLVLSSANKSDLSVGHQLLGGDSSHGLAVLSDVPKIIVHKLAHFSNNERELISKALIELEEESSKKPHKYGNETAPPYVLLDLILELYVNYQLSCEDIINSHGYAENTVRWVQRKVDLNEWKRQQAPPGIRVTSRAFGMCRRMPTVQGFVD
ncbi:NAD(+) synthase [Rubritalea profundi]|uniref:Glutamine-dependent NAD(+) synthetase n=1 Tax=Rubritalea profundi TaxID=1658618 RepID=A0A2S7U680_9BACT|nr:NAD(+) synthase [Rubritalea profundi]PQJ29951.1 NAD(+) synthase [Rubritalea profundi]